MKREVEMADGWLKEGSKFFYTIERQAVIRRDFNNQVIYKTIGMDRVPYLITASNQSFYPASECYNARGFAYAELKNKLTQEVNGCEKRLSEAKKDLENAERRFLDNDP